MEIQLTSGDIVNVKKIGIFDLDELVPESLGKFTHKYEIMGIEYDMEFDPRKFEEAPERPMVTEELIPQSDLWWKVQEYNLYHAALAHESKKQDQIIKFYDAVKDYILTTCISPSDKAKIKTAEDWKRIYEGSLVERLTMELIIETLDKTFHATFQGVPILEATKNLDKGHGSVDTVKLWEVKLMNTLNMTELEYSLLPVQERARKVCALFLDDIMGSLETDLKMKEAKKK